MARDIEVTAYAGETEPIHPDMLYPLSAFMRCAGMSRTRMRQGRNAGVSLETINCGRRKFVEGRKGIDYIKRLSAIKAS